MKKKLNKVISLTFIYLVILSLFTTYVLLDTFVIQRAYQVVSNTNSANVIDTSQQIATSFDAETVFSDEVISTETAYVDANIRITITTYRQYDTNIYVADIYLSGIQYLSTALANNTYGRNITAKTSEIAEDNDAILAINGDYYGAQTKGYVIRNGVIYRSAASDASTEDLVIYTDGTMDIVTEGSTTAEELLADGAWQVLSFGPGLIDDGTITVSTSDEVDKAMTDNPRTAIGMIDTLHYVMVVSDGRTDESTGLTLYELATFMQSLGVTTAYNLDGGGSSTMYFNGNIINNPTTTGETISERSVSDIVYIG
ncbi:MAG: phosphodiester glycosidase family protein [Erysipelotrichaceae bacterium]|nr:phosphodiester glycosidase family protein [Erysipelotrichaceae bacterium]